MPKNTRKPPKSPETIRAAENTVRDAELTRREGARPETLAASAADEAAAQMLLASAQRRAEDEALARSRAARAEAAAAAEARRLREADAVARMVRATTQAPEPSVTASVQPRVSPVTRLPEDADATANGARLGVPQARDLRAATQVRDRPATSAVAPTSTTGGVPALPNDPALSRLLREYAEVSRPLSTRRSSTIPLQAADPGLAGAILRLLGGR